MADIIPFKAPTNPAPSQWYTRTYGVNLGLRFTAVTSFKLDGLGSYWKAGTSGTETVGLFDYDDPLHPLLTWTTLTKTSVASDGYYFASIPLYTLTAGHTYTMVVYIAANTLPYAVMSSAPIDQDPSQVTLLTDKRYVNYGTGLQFPNSTNSLNFFGPNFEIYTASGVPEPGFLLLLGLGIGIIALLAWRTKA